MKYNFPNRGHDGATATNYCRYIRLMRTIRSYHDFLSNGDGSEDPVLSEIQDFVHDPYRKC